MRVAVLSCNAQLNNGWGVITLNLCRALAEHGVDVSLFLPAEHSKLRCEEPYEVCYRLPSNGVNFGVAQRLRASVNPSVEYLFQGFDVIHNLFAVSTFLIAEKVANRFDLPLIAGAQGTYGVLPFLRSLERSVFTRLLMRADAFVTPSQFTRSCMASFLDSDKFIEKSSVIPNGIDYDRFAEVGIGDRCNQHRFVGVGALKKRKGFHVSLRAFSEVLREYPEATYTIIGSGACRYREYLRHLVSSLNICRSVRFCGELTGSALVDEMSRASVYVHTPTSLGWNFEGFGIVYLEANALGLPAVGSKSGGVSDAICDGKTGVLANEYDYLDTARKMMEVVENETRYQLLSANAREWAKSHDWSVVARQFISLHEDF